ncbi:Vacuolar protein sorting-associated protein 36 [Rhynchospora pubera]|uniref:Vacuolar protein-sorting-associated protein 36 n=1 Tax=Rhynchospora pubera TaxID=906938 RepID=A0AAV8FX91_9POAL|nr:Vacuolar protein sorting-associated protein 36 [Rhynchospora pubera]
MTSIPRLPTASLTTSCRPVFFSGEVERYLLPGVDLESDGSDRPTLLLPFQSSLLVITSHRLVFVDEASSSAREIALSAIIHAFPLKKSMSIRSMFASPRVRLQVSISNDGTISEKGTKSSVITLVMRGKNTDPDVFYGKFMEVLRSREWELTASANQGSTGLEGSSSASGVNDLRITMPVVGVSGILRKEQEIWESTDKNLQDAFQDLNALMSKAKEMVQLAEKMRQKLLTTGSNSQGSSNDEEMGSKQDMQDWLLSVGIASPVTKETAGALYHQQLSRQLADFVKTPLEKAGGMITLVDVYCLFNRARGTELISPEDLLQACALWEKFNVPVMMRKFDSGVKVIQNKSHSDDEVFARISSLAQKPDALRKGVSPSDAAFTLGIAPALAKEHLLSAESRGLLCRDVSAEGLRFYINLFNEIDSANTYTIKSHGLLNAWHLATTVSG